MHEPGRMPESGREACGISVSLHQTVLIEPDGLELRRIWLACSDDGIDVASGGIIAWPFLTLKDH
eukprot:5494881-Alexandrium_andersonii.AAC.1